MPKIKISKKPEVNIPELRGKILSLMNEVLDEVRIDPEITWPQKVSALNVCGRLVPVMMKAFSDEPDVAGATVRKYAQAFRENATGGGKARSGRPTLAIDNEPGPNDPDDDPNDPDDPNDESDPDSPDDDDGDSGAGF
jgi:hypothetical protein